MSKNAPPNLRRGWTTGACATAAVKAALIQLWGGDKSGGPRGALEDSVTITLPRGETPVFAVAHRASGPGWAEAGVTKDAGDDPDVTHGALIKARVRAGGQDGPDGLSAQDGHAKQAGQGGQGGQGIRFRAGEGVGIVTKPGLPIAVGEPAINPVPRQMMRQVVIELAEKFHQPVDVEITISIPGGAALAAKTWNPRLGILGGLSVLGTTGIVRPFSCSAWIASIHRGVDVARASGLRHVAGCTGATSERSVQMHHALPDQAMLDMGDFAGGLLKYLRRHPVDRLTIGGGIGKLTKLAQGAIDLHSARTQVDFDLLADWLGDTDVQRMNTALQAYEKHTEKMAALVAEKALGQVVSQLRGAPVTADIIVVGRDGAILAQTGGAGG